MLMLSLVLVLVLVLSLSLSCLYVKYSEACLCSPVHGAATHLILQWANIILNGKGEF